MSRGDRFEDLDPGPVRRRTVQFGGSAPQHAPIAAVREIDERADEAALADAGAAAHEHDSSLP